MKVKQQIKGAIRKLFTRSDLYKEVLINSIHPTIKGKRGGKQYICSVCGNTFQQKDIQVDHINPVIPIGKKIDDLDYNDIYNNIFCGKDNLQVVCKDCHKIKSTEERKLRKHYGNKI